MDDMGLGKRLRNQRDFMGLTQEELSGLSGIGRTAIQEIEGGEGNPTVETIVALSGALKKDLVLFDVDNFVPRRELHQVMKSLGDRHDEMNAQLVKLTKEHRSLEQKYIKVFENLEASRFEAATLRAQIKASHSDPLIVEGTAILAALNESERKLAVSELRRLRDSLDRRNGPKDKKRLREK